MVSAKFIVRRLIGLAVCGGAALDFLCSTPISGVDRPLPVDRTVERQDDEIDVRAKAMYLAAWARRDEVQHLEIEFEVELRDFEGQPPGNYRSIEQVVIDRVNRRYYFQQEMVSLNGKLDSKSEFSRILIRDGVCYQKLPRNDQQFSFETLKSETSLTSINEEVQMFNVFLLGAAAVSLSDFGPDDYLEQMRDFDHVKSLHLGKSINDRGTTVQELIFRSAEDEEAYVWIDPVALRFHRFDTPGVSTIASQYDNGNGTAFPSRVEIVAFNGDSRIRETTINVSRLELAKEFQEEDFKLQRIKPVLNDLAVDYDQKRIVGRWNGYSYLGEDAIESPTVEAAIIQERLRGQTPISWLTYLTWFATALVAVYLLVRLTRLKAKNV